MKKDKSKKKQKLSQKDLIRGNFKTKGNLGTSALAVARDFGIGYLAGGLMGSAIGRPATLVGIGVTGLGHYVDAPNLCALGFGIMMGYKGGAGAPPQTVQGTGLQGKWDGAKARMKTYKDDMLHNLYLDKLFKKKATTQEDPGGGTIEGYAVGNPHDVLNEIEADLVRAAAEQRMLNPAETPTMGIGSDNFDYEPVSEVGEEIQEEVFLDPEEVIY